MKTHSDYQSVIEKYNQEITRCLEESLESKTIDKYKEKISDLIAKDGKTTELIFRKISSLEIDIPEIKKHLKEANKNKMDFEKAKVQLNNIFKILTKKNKNDALNSILGSISSLESILRENVDEVLISNKKSKQEIIDKIEEKIEEKSEEIINKLEEVSKAKKSENYKVCNLNDFKAYFDSYNYEKTYSEESYQIERYFKVLIFDSSDNSLKRENFDLFLTILTNFDWNIIIDLSPNASNTNFMISKNPEGSHMKKNFKEINGIIPNIELVFSGERLCYITSENIDPDEFSELSNLRIFLDKTEFKKCVSEFNFVSFNFHIDNVKSHEHLEILNEINEIFKNYILQNNKKKKLDSVNILLDEIDIDQEELLRTTLTNSEKISNDLLIPIKDSFGNLSEIDWKLEQEESDKTFIEVYHKNIGKPNKLEDDDEEIEKFFFNKKLFFLKGNEIDPETIYLNDVMKKFTYYESKQIIELNEKITKKANKGEFFSNNSLIIDITHEPGSGGTTVGRVLLFKNREKYPCIRIKILNLNFLESILNKFSKMSKLTLLILIDCSDVKSISRKDVENFSRTLASNETIKHLILFVHRSNDKPNISSILDDTELLGFEKLYKEFLGQKQFKENDNEILFFKSLLTFKLTRLKMSDVDDLTELIKCFCNDIDDQGKDLFVLTYFNYKFSSKPYFSKNLTATLLRTSLKEMSEFYKKINKKLASLKYFRFKINQGFEPLDIGLFEKMLDFIFPSENHLELFLKIFINLVENVGYSDEDLIDMTRSLLTNYNYGYEKKAKKSSSNKKKENDLTDSDGDEQNFESDNESSISDLNDGTKKFFSPLVCEFSKKFDSEKTEEYLLKFFDLFNNEKELWPYLGSLCARFKFHKNDNFEKKIEAVQIFRKALNIDEKFDSTNYPYFCKKSDLLCSYGDILRHFSKEKEKNNQSYDEIIKTCEEAVDVYEESQKLDEDNEVALIGECKIRFNILFFHFKNKCNENSVKFIESLDNCPKIIKESERKIEAKFDKLERLIFLKELEWDNRLNQIYFNCKMEILKLRMNNVTLINLMKLPSDNYQIGLSNLINLNKNISNQLKLYVKDYFSYDFNVDHLISLINRFRLQSKKGISLLSSSYRDWLSCVIHLSNKKHSFIQKNYDVRSVIELSEMWKKKFNLEPEPYFFLGIFNFIQGLETNQKEYFEKAKANFKICFEKYKNMNPAPKIFRRGAFVIGKEGGIFSLLKHDLEKDKNNIIDEYREFEGELVRDYRSNDKLEVIFNGLKIRYLDRNSLDPKYKLSETEKDQKKKFKFFILIRRCGLTMYKFRRCD
ncbi:unnamed protein product [Brachionus calyciflorus]|uniref:Uncharacterized protein n=1 Tax=Brachionus calyciflorus TaxID=104777 RepID=A0A813TJW2_9BILA|nr:unnamed protein product [Brachionus calyciflorus]